MSTYDTKLPAGDGASKLPITPTIALAVRTAIGLQDIPLGVATRNDLLISNRLATWGDSLTMGTGGTPYPQQFSVITGWAYYNGGIGGETSTQIRARMVADTAKSGWPTIIWAGRNNYADPVTVKADIAAMVASLGHNRYLVMGVTSGFGGSENIGTTNGLIIAALNADLAAIYGIRFVDSLAALVAAYNPSIPQDVTDHNNGVPPSSLRSDAVHLNTAGYGVIAAAVAAKEAILFPDPESIITNRNISEILTSPPEIGQILPNAAAFSAVGVGQAAPSSGLRILDSTLALAGTTTITWAGTNLSMAKSGDGFSVHFRGSLIPYANNDGSIGSLTFRWAHGYFAQDVFAPAFKTYAATAANTAGAAVALIGGASTGTASGGPVSIQATPGGAAGSTVNTPVTIAQFDLSTTGGDTRMLLWDVTAGSLRRVSIGAADSGGSGFRVLRIPN